MRRRSTDRGIGSLWMAMALLIAAGPATARAQDYGTAPAPAPTAPPAAAATPPPPPPATPAHAAAATTTQATPEAKPTFEIYGFAMLDIGQDLGARINPN